MKMHCNEKSGFSMFIETRMIVNCIRKRVVWVFTFMMQFQEWTLGWSKVCMFSASYFDLKWKPLHHCWCTVWHLSLSQVSRGLKAILNLWILQACCDDHNIPYPWELSQSTVEMLLMTTHTRLLGTATPLPPSCSTCSYRSSAEDSDVFFFHVIALMQMQRKFLSHPFERRHSNNPQHLPRLTDFAFTNPDPLITCFRNTMSASRPLLASPRSILLPFQRSSTPWHPWHGLHSGVRSCWNQAWTVPLTTFSLVEVGTSVCTMTLHQMQISSGLSEDSWRGLHMVSIGFD